MARDPAEFDPTTIRATDPDWTRVRASWDSHFRGPSVSPLDWLRRLLGPPAQQPDVHIHVTPSTVIRPGDTVVLCVPGHPVGMKHTLVEAAEKWAPEGVRIAVFTGEDVHALNLTRALQDVLGAHGGDRSGHAADHAGAERSKPAGEAAKGPVDLGPDPSERPVAGADDLAVVVLPAVSPPEPSPEPLSDPHAEASP